MRGEQVAHGPGVCGRFRCEKISLMSKARRAVTDHVKRFFEGHDVRPFNWSAGPIRKRVPDFGVLAVAPGPKLVGLWTFISVGCWDATQQEGHGLEFALIARGKDDVHAESLAMTAYYHAGPPEQRLDHGHTVPIGRPWLTTRQAITSWSRSLTRSDRSLRSVPGEGATPVSSGCSRSPRRSGRSKPPTDSRLSKNVSTRRASTSGTHTGRRWCDSKVPVADGFCSAAAAGQGRSVSPVSCLGSGLLAVSPARCRLACGPARHSTRRCRLEGLFRGGRGGLC